MADKHRETVSLVNCLRGTGEPVKWLRWWSAFHGAISIYAGIKDLNLVMLHKAFLGRQDYCYTLTRRYWVWEFGGYRVWVHNKEGISLEVDAGTSPDKAVEYMQDYVNKWPFDFDAICDLYLEGTEEALEKIHDHLDNAGD